VTAPLLEVRNLHVELPLRRGLVRAVDGASFVVERGEALGIAGESGCGKTMTLRALVGLLPRPARISGGTIVFDGADVTAAAPQDVRALRGRSISMIFQEPSTSLNPTMRIVDQIEEGPRVRLGLGRRAARSRALELMRTVGIADAAERGRSYPHELSGGLRQRVMIAIALSCEPQLILCDEPTSSLDVTTQDQILNLLHSLREQLGLSLVFVSHDLAVIARTCDRVAIMYAGQIVETGPVEAVLGQPRHAYTLGLLGSVPDIDRPRKRLPTMAGAPPDLASPPAGCRYHPRCPFCIERCQAGELALRPIPGNRATSCIRDEVVAEDAAARLVIPGV
jgi:oligopeptide/dipeptide ABC transporter ATP-binding protein